MVGYLGNDQPYRMSVSEVPNALVDSRLVNVIANRPASLDDKSEETLTGTRVQLRSCLASHLSCRSANSRFLPSRLLDVGETRAVLDFDVRLVSSRKFPAHELRQYAALSYCWGSDDESKARQVRTTTRNHLDHHIRIERVDLPRTVQDAITVTRRLGIRYIWIDALCIIQDDPDDRDVQLPMMGEIYANAAVTICASSAPGCNDGFLKQRAFPRFIVPHSWQGRFDPWPVTFMEAKDCPTFGDEPIHERGWTFQETLLSRRILFFTSAGPFFWCRTPGSEKGGLSTPSIGAYFEHASLRELLDVYGSDQILSPKFKWLWLVSQYSSRTFTNVADRRWAFDGIAKAHQPLRGGAQNSSGVWSDSLHLDLLWQSPARPRTGRPEISRRISLFPTWSWLSFDGQIDYPKLSADKRKVDPEKDQDVEEQPHAKDEVEKKDVEAKLSLLQFPTSITSQGMISDSLVVRGKVKSVVLPAWKDTYGMEGVSPQMVPPHVLDCYGSALWDAKNGRYSRFAFGSDRSKIGKITFDIHDTNRWLVEEDRSQKANVYECIHVATIRPFEYEMRTVDGTHGPASNRQVSMRVGKRAYALVLEKVVSEYATNVRRRVGVLTTFDGDGAKYFDNGKEETIVLI